ncbi:MAG: HNH endonuclease [bacterium]|nr:HNH endonuclease [bacterium]
MTSSYVPKALRQRISEQARDRCGYCLSQEAIVGAPMEIEHIFPKSLGGLTAEENLWLACSFCNEYKGDRYTAEDPESGRIVLLFNPRHDAWNEHFAWVDAGARILGKTPIGRATVNTLRLNRRPLVRSRRYWVSAGWHPPSD